ncbi:T9SS type A sorting domain-containing protein [Halosquirtibacter laminarini]|uniref:T9SS type A sorting domain-containing protein n=1 Tax=Halosquirtibacter laminarini TaxID=3374600 RepID=A0AC61NF58_9BACT|nr:T9SS type A sorting domain-containing protein [Prolixibacteraceae bacterium]
MRILCVLLMGLFLWSNVSLGQMKNDATEPIYNWDKFDVWEMLELFYQVHQDGRKFPSDKELEQYGFDIEFVRCHVKPREVIVDQATQVNPSINPHRKLWMNIPGGNSKINGGYPSEDWNNDVYTGWNYTYLFGNWNHSWFQSPAAFVGAAHKHGTDALSGLMFFDWGENSTAVLDKLLAKENGVHKYAEPLINLLMFIGQDGINFNVEGTEQNSERFQLFNKNLYDIAKDRGYTHFHVGFYNNYSTLSRQPNNLWRDGGWVSDALMLNYGMYNLEESVKLAKSLSPLAVNGLYQGLWISGLSHSWTKFQTVPDMNICCWGEHSQCRLFSYATGNSSKQFQECYQEKIEKFMSGGNQNPADLPTIKNNGVKFESNESMSQFHGLATFIAERSSVQGKLPFKTNFNLGNGSQFHYKGRRSYGKWYNMGAQDMMPTYRWLVYRSNTTTVSKLIHPSLSHEDAYMGGSMLKLTGSVDSEGTDVILYRTDLVVQEVPKAVLAIKMPYLPKGTATNLSIIIKTDKGGENWIEYPIGKTTEEHWNKIELDLNGIGLNDMIKQIGLRVKGEEKSEYMVYVGEIGIYDSFAKSVAMPENFKAEVKRETTASMSIKLNWEMSKVSGSTPVREEYGLLYNDDVNVDHFEVIYKNGKNGRAKVISSTNTWSQLIPHLIFTEDDYDNDIIEAPFIGVRAVSKDLKSYSKINWIEIPRQDYYDLPEEKIDRYCTSTLDPNSPKVEKARSQRWVKSIKTTGAITDIVYETNHPVVDGSNYVNYTASPIVAKQGSSFVLNFVGFDSKDDGLRYCFANAYVDWNDDGEFVPGKKPGEGELVFQLGNANAATPALEDPSGVDITFNVPEKAAPRDLRLRIVFQDAWFPNFTPCGLTHKGFTIDLKLRVTGTNKPDIKLDVRDPREVEEPEHMDGYVYTDIKPNYKLQANRVSSMYPNPSSKDLFFKCTDSVLIYDLSGKLVQSVSGGVEYIDISSLPKGVYMVKIERDNVIRVDKLIKN